MPLNLKINQIKRNYNRSKHSLKKKKSIFFNSQKPKNNHIQLVKRYNTLTLEVQVALAVISDTCIFTLI